MKTIKEILDPILDLATGVDGGNAFIKLQTFLTSVIEDHGTEVDTIQAFIRVSNACKNLLGEY